MRIDRVKGSLDLLLLAVLADGPLHGYAVITALRDRSDATFEMTEGAVYPALHRLERGGQLASAWEEVGGRRRKSYRLTEDGGRTLARERRDWHEFVAAVQSVLGPLPRVGAAVS